ncbi:LTA synthase family protein [Ravibacter arvi]
MRILLACLSLRDADLSLGAVARIFSTGFLFDLGACAFFLLPYAIYLAIWPARFNQTLANRLLTYTGFVLATLIFLFSLFSEVTFWLEFESRFNFIAVDYLVYTHEVAQNINESYPMPLLVSVILAGAGLLTLVLTRRGIFRSTFRGRTPLFRRLLILGAFLATSAIYGCFLGNNLAEKGQNRYQDELSKNGIYSIFSAFKNNELNYQHFYPLIDDRKAFTVVRDALAGDNVRFLDDGLSIRRHISAVGKESRPNVILVTIESLSADYLAHFGNKQHLTPVLDSLAKKSLVFEQMYATGTRTVRGMEALTLSIPPTPGSSIVRRPDNGNLTTVGSIFQSKGYETSFIYGGDGYFDNMNQFFGGNGFDITDKGRSATVGDKFAAARTIIPDSLVQFQNAWGICDEDLYTAVLRNANKNYAGGKPFFSFVMTTSNHRPFTYPSGKIDIPSGTGREGTVRYTDYAIGQFLENARKQPWYANTVFIFVADHCASSAGKNDIDVTKYHIPAIVYNLPAASPGSVPVLCSQIDLLPTLFGLLQWDYDSNLYGLDVRSATYRPRALLGTYQKLAYLQNNRLTILSPQQHVESLVYANSGAPGETARPDKKTTEEAISYYQTAYYLFKSGLLKQK